MHSTNFTQKLVFTNSAFARRCPHSPYTAAAYRRIHRTPHTVQPSPSSRPSITCNVVQNVEQRSLRIDCFDRAVSAISASASFVRLSTTLSSHNDAQGGISFDVLPPFPFIVQKLTTISLINTLIQVNYGLFRIKCLSCYVVCFDLLITSPFLRIQKYLCI